MMDELAPPEPISNCSPPAAAVVPSAERDEARDTLETPAIAGVGTSASSTAAAPSSGVQPVSATSGDAVHEAANVPQGDALVTTAANSDSLRVAASAPWEAAAPPQADQAQDTTGAQSDS